VTDAAPRQSAVGLAARLFALRMRRTKALLLGRPVGALDDERTHMLAALVAQLDAEADELAARSRASRARLAASLGRRL
jgi:hypothetical protein